MLQGSERVRLALQALKQIITSGEVLWHELQRHFHLIRHSHRPINHAHAATANHLQYFIAGHGGF